MASIEETVLYGARRSSGLAHLLAVALLTAGCAAKAPLGAANGAHAAASRTTSADPAAPSVILPNSASTIDGAPPKNPADLANPSTIASGVSATPSTIAPGDSIATHERSTVQIAPGVYVIRHEDAPDTFPQGNTMVVVGDREALVLDSCYLPSSAKKDIAQIRKWTNKPVRYLVNSHWHYDHTMGNGAYKDAFSGLTIVSHSETRKQIEGYNPQWFTKFPDRAKTFKQRIESGKDADGRQLTEGEIAEFKTALAGIEPVWAEFRALGARRDMVPSLAFDREFDVDLGSREVRVLHLGRGNTAGDAVVYLPREKILAAGDLLDHPVPYLGGGYPVELIATLESMARLDFETIVPGHGKVLQGKAYLGQVIEFLRTVVTEVDREIHRTGSGPRNLDAVKKAVLAKVDVATWRQRFAGDDKENRDFFDGFSMSGLITAAYAELWPR
jgi:glyoxylase-like metal-dependent hydrolase (beta-lactamase superfamily II)